VNPTSLFHPAVAAWFDRNFVTPTAAQAAAWPAIQAGRHVLIAAPTGSGKTLAAFLAAIDGLVRQGLEGGLRDETQIVYVSPLKALSNDIQRNLEAPLAGVREALRAQGLPDVDILSWVRTGDTPPGERQRMGRAPPHIVVTTPESLYILLGSDSGRTMLATKQSRGFWSDPTPSAGSSTQAIAGSVISPSKSLPRRSRRSCRAKSGSRSMTGWPS